MTNKLVGIPPLPKRCLTWGSVLLLVALVLLPTIFQPLKASTRVNTAKLMGAAVRKVTPRYNETAKMAKAQGQVEIEVTVGENGSVKASRAVSGHMMLREEAKSAAAQWKFDPSKLSDPPTEVIGVLVFNFKLDS